MNKFILLLVIVVSGCSTPKEIDGRKVINTRWVDGKVVHVLAPAEGEKEAINRETEQMRKDAERVTFAPRD